MKIEVDTQRDSKEELFHLANMLKALSGKLEHSVSERSVEDKSRDIFSDDSSPGLFGMFSDPAPQSSPSASQDSQYAPVPQQTAQAAPTLFSIFSDPVPSSATPAAVAIQDSGLDASNDYQYKKKSSAEDILDDVRIELY